MSAGITEDGVRSLLNSAKTMLFGAALFGNTRSLVWAQASMKTLNALLNGSAQRHAEFSRSKGGYEVPAIFQGAWPVLPDGIENFTMVEVQQFFRSHGVKIAFDAVADSKLDAVIQLEDGALTSINSHNEHDAALADLDDGSGLHVASPVGCVTVQQGGAA